MDLIIPPHGDKKISVLKTLHKNVFCEWLKQQTQKENLQIVSKPFFFPSCEYPPQKKRQSHLFFWMSDRFLYMCI